MFIHICKNIEKYCVNIFELKRHENTFLQSVYGRSTLHKTGSLEEHARNVAKYREAQAENIKMGIRVNPNSTNLLAVDNDFPRYEILTNFIRPHLYYKNTQVVIMLKK